MKKFLSLSLALILCVALSVPAFAANYTSYTWSDEYTTMKFDAAAVATETIKAWDYDSEEYTNQNVTMITVKPGSSSLSLDLSEVFKPVIVFRTIFDLVNNHRLQVEKHFEKNVNYCILNEEGRKIFVKAFEERMESVFEHSRLKRKVTYRTALKLDCYKLIKNILEDKEFVPFLLKEGM